MSETLVIIDMQPKFSASNDKELRAPLVREIERAKRNNFFVIVVEYDFLGHSINWGFPLDSDYHTKPTLYKTHHYIKKALVGYKNKKTVKKAIDDGSRYIDRIISQYKLPKRVRVCGVNTDCCVAATVLGLKDLRYKVTAVADCMQSEHCHEFGVNELRKYSKVIRAR